MKYFFMIALTITDDAWVEAYVANVTTLVHKHGGHYAVRTDKVDKYEGERPIPSLAILVEWPSREAADAFYDDPDYQPYKEARQAGSVAEFLVVPGEDIAQA